MLTMSHQGEENGVWSLSWTLGEHLRGWSQPISPPREIREHQRNHIIGQPSPSFLRGMMLLTTPRLATVLVLRHHLIFLLLRSRHSFLCAFILRHVLDCGFQINSFAIIATFDSWPDPFGL